ncbi:MAG: homoserine lactone transporter [Arcobacter sp.]|nr:MAG: homoserine lactone transporter [Arcobacter sp.]
MSFESLLTFALIVFFIAIIPGPNALLVLFTALSNNKSRAFANVAGVSCGFLIHAFISALGLSLLLSQSLIAFTLLKILGVFYLLYLGFTHFKAAYQLKKIEAPKSEAQKGLMNNFAKGLLTNLLNPKIILFYLSIFPQFVSSSNILEDSLLLGAIQAIVVSFWFLIIILLSQYLKDFLSKAKNASFLNYFAGSVFVLFSYKLANSK